MLAGTLVTVTATNRLAVGTANVDFAGLALSPDPISLAGGETKSATFTSPAGGTSNFQIQLTGNGQAIDYDVSCVSPGNVTINKETTGGTGAFTFDTSFNGVPGSFPITTTAEATPVAHNETLSIGTYVFTEQSLAGWTLDDIVCSANGGTVVVDEANRKVTITVTAANIGATPVCTFKNSLQPATLNLSKVTSSGDGTFDFGVDDSASGTISKSITTSGGAGSVAAFNINAGTVTITEAANANYELTGATCTGATATLSPATRTLTLTGVTNGAIVNCQFTNGRKSTLSIAKATSSLDGTFDFTVDDAATGTIAESITTSGGTGSILAPIVLNSGTVTITEAANANYELTAASCVGATPTVDLANRTVSFTATPNGTAINCTFTNGRKPTLKLTKTTSAGDGTFGFTVDHSVTGATSPSITTTSGTGSTTPVVIGSGTVTITEATHPDYTLTSIDCVGATSPIYDTGTGQRLSRPLRTAAQSIARSSTRRKPPLSRS